MAYDDGPIRHVGGGPSWRPSVQVSRPRPQITRDIEFATRNPHLRDHLSEAERIRIGTRQHPIVLLKPALAVVAAFAFFLRAVSDPGALRSTQDVFLVAVLVALVWLGVRWLKWSRHFFLATDQRVLKMYGVLSTTVDSMKVQKVTDMKYHRSFLGELIGYGSITIESAGQEQALHDISYIPYPRENYQELCHIIIGEDPRTGGRKKHRFRRRIETLTRRRGGHGPGEADYPDDFDDGLDEYDEHHHDGYADDFDDADRGAPTRRRPAGDPAPRMLYSSTEGRLADTSPIPIYPPGYFAGRDDDGYDEDYHADPTRP
ncbi:MAG TPA: PH domain-containing protein [Intrasporangiaceae bacterium]|nr:PH domain-containing protein [Intrasporangiaceae bacterium]